MDDLKIRHRVQIIAVIIVVLAIWFCCLRAEPVETKKQNFYICYTPMGRIIPSENKALSFTRDVWIAKQANAGIHLWVLPTLVFNRTKSVEEVNPVAYQWYKDFTEYAIKENIDVIAKVPSWSTIWWNDPNTGVYDPITEREKFEKEVQFQADMINHMMKIFHIKRWIIGNEPQMELVKYGQSVSMQSGRHSPTIQVRILEELFKRLNPPTGVEIYGPALLPAGVSSFGIGLQEPNVFSEMLWDKIGQYCKGLAINAYPPKNGGNFVEEYGKLNKNIKWITSEQGIRFDWVGENEEKHTKALWQLYADTFQVFDSFSYFILRSPRGLDHFAVINSDGMIYEYRLHLLFEFGKTNKKECE